MLNKIELKNNQQIKKIEEKLKKSKQVEIYKTTYWFLFILILFCSISLIVSIILYYLVEDLFPYIPMSKLFLDITSENDIAGKTYSINNNTHVINISHATWNGLPEFTQNSNVSKLLDQNNTISCYKCNICIPTINKKCIIGNDNLFNNSVHKDIWFNIRNIKHHNFKYKDHNIYSYNCHFKYISRNEINSFYNSINEKTEILDIAKSVINFGRSLHKYNDTSYFKCDLSTNYKGIIFVQNNDIANTIPYSYLESTLIKKLQYILDISNIPKDEIEIFSNIIFNRLLGISDINSRKSKQFLNKSILDFVITRSKSEIDKRRIDNENFTPFKSCAIDIFNINRKVYTILNTISNTLNQNDVLLVIGNKEYTSQNYYNEIDRINKEIVIGTKSIVEHCAFKIFDPTNEDTINMFSISYKDKRSKKRISIDVYNILMSVEPNDYKLENEFSLFKHEFIYLYGKNEYYNFIASIYDIVLTPIFKSVSNNKIGQEIKKLSVISHTDNSDLIEINSNLSQYLVPNRTLKLTNSSYNYNLFLQIINIDSFNLSTLINIINLNYYSSYKYKDLIDPTNIVSTIPNLIATDIIRFIETDKTICRNEVKYNSKIINEYLSVMYHWSYLISDLNKFRYIPDNKFIIPNTEIQILNISKKINEIKSRKNNFFSKKLSNNLIPKNIYSILKSNNILFECYMYQNNIIKFNNLQGLNIVGIDILLDELNAYILRSNIYNSDIKSYYNININNNEYINKLKFIKEKDLYLISLPYEELNKINSEERNYIFDKIDQIPNVIYNNLENISRLFFLVSKKTKKAICVDAIPCILGSIIDESIKYSNITKLIHEIVYPISSNKININRVAINLLMPAFKFNDDFYSRNNKLALEILNKIFSYNIQHVISVIPEIITSNINIKCDNNNIVTNLIANKDVSNDICIQYSNNFNKSLNYLIGNSKLNNSFMELFNLTENISNINSDSNILYDQINSIKQIKTIKVKEINNEYHHEISLCIHNLDRNKFKNLCKQINKSETEIHNEHYNKYKKYIDLFNIIHLSPVLNNIKYSEIKLDSKSNYEIEKLNSLIKEITEDCQKFDSDYGNKCRDGNKIHHLKLNLIDKLYQISSIFFID